ncbi:unnamed protein product [Cylicocyclus nassatus]|uniref:Uncharacterized protein n=1 Tax=Cylicocyclus nassatus TaxID=53992 RepID=A0AA36DSY1_CYLNA|nr:unnamed protein product [Cylicocyclus nassatus]
MFLLFVLLILKVAINASGINETIGPSGIDGPMNASDIHEPLNASDIYELDVDDVATSSAINELCSYMRKISARIQHAKNFCKASDACDGLSNFFLHILGQLSRKAREYRCG